MKAAVVQIKGDLAEFTATMGFPTRPNLWHPCYKCACSRDQLQTSVGATPPTRPALSPEAPADYEDACQFCEPWALLSHGSERQALLGGVLFFDKRASGNHGRCLRVDMVGLGLLAGDRLEPCQGLPDSMFLEACARPRWFRFW